MQKFKYLGWKNDTEIQTCIGIVKYAFQKLSKSSGSWQIEEELLFLH